MVSEKTVNCEGIVPIDIHEDPEHYINKGFAYIMEGLKKMGYPINTDPNFTGTGLRASKGFREMILPPDQIKAEVDKYLSVVFPTPSDSMVISPPIQTASVCPHHLLPILYTIRVAYLPGVIKEGAKAAFTTLDRADFGKPPQEREVGPRTYGVLGLSKIPRIVQTVARQPIMQETLTYELAEIFHARLKSEGAAIYTRGRHMCMECRGVELPDANTVSSKLTGLFLEKDRIRAEFMAAVNAEERR